MNPTGEGGNDKFIECLTAETDVEPDTDRNRCSG